MRSYFCTKLAFTLYINTHNYIETRPQDREHTVSNFLCVFIHSFYRFYHNFYVSLLDNSWSSRPFTLKYWCAPDCFFRSFSTIFFFILFASSNIHLFFHVHENRQKNSKLKWKRARQQQIKTWTWKRWSSSSFSQLNITSIIITENEKWYFRCV